MTKIDPRLYRDTTARIAKKHIGRSLHKLKYAVNLNPGDLLSTCKGYNEIIVEIQTEWTTRSMRKGAVVYDFNFVTETGCSCSAIHCCSFPLETRDQIYESWKRWLPPTNAKVDEMCGRFVEYAKKIEEIRNAGGHAFDEDGQPYYEFLHDWEKKIRFPEMWKQEVEVNLEGIVKKNIKGRYGNNSYGSQLANLVELSEDEIKIRLKKFHDWETIFERIVWSGSGDPQG